MSDLTSVSRGLATLGASGWTVNESSTRGQVGSGKETSVIAHGDSYENFCGPYVSGIWLDYPQIGYLAQMNSRLGWPYRIIPAGVGGQTSVQIVDRWFSSSQYVPADRVFFGSGTNDDLSTQTKIDTVIAALTRAYDHIRNRGQGLTIRNHISKNASSGAQLEGDQQLNQFKAAYVRRWPRCKLLDIAAIGSHPQTGHFLLAGEFGAIADYVQADGAHMSGELVSIVAKYAAEDHADVVQPSTYWLAQGDNATAIDAARGASIAVNPYGNLIANGKMIGTAGTNPASAVIPGSPPTGWNQPLSLAAVPSGGGTGTVAVVARNGPYSRGNATRWDFSGGSSGVSGFVRLERESMITAFDGSQGVSIGDKVYAACMLDVSATDYGGTDGLSPTTFELRVDARDSGFAALAGARWMPAATPNSILARWPTGTVAVTPEFALPVGTAHVYVTALWNGKGQVDFWDVSARKSRYT